MLTTGGVCLAVIFHPRTILLGNPDNFNVLSVWIAPSCSLDKDTLVAKRNGKLSTSLPNLDGNFTIIYIANINDEIIF